LPAVIKINMQKTNKAKYAKNCITLLSVSIYSHENNITKKAIIFTTVIATIVTESKVKLKST
jgi:hypothetical protein